MCCRYVTLSSAPGDGCLCTKMLNIRDFDSVSSLMLGIKRWLRPHVADEMDITVSPLPDFLSSPTLAQMPRSAVSKMEIAYPVDNSDFVIVIPMVP